MILNSDVRDSKNNMFQMPTDMVGIFFGNIEFCNKTCMIILTKENKNSIINIKSYTSYTVEKKCT